MLIKHPCEQDTVGSQQWKDESFEFAQVRSRDTQCRQRFSYVIADA